MIIKVRTRSNGAQLGWYLVTMLENDKIEILEVDGREDADAEYLRQTIMSMEYNCELTKGEKPFFTGEINPAYGEDKAMTREDWYLAANMTSQANDYQNQRRVIVLHHKKGRIHAHVVWERYDHETGKLLPLKNSVYKTNDMRPKIEDALGHKRTSHHNTHKSEVKAIMTKLWNDTENGDEFLKATRKAGFIIAAGTGNKPFMVVNENGCFNLVRQIEGVRTKDVRARLRGKELVTDKKAIEIIRELQESGSGKRERQQMTHRPSAQIISTDFADNRIDATAPNEAEVLARNHDQALNAFKIAAGDMAVVDRTLPTDDQRKQDIARQFAENELSGKTPAKKPDLELQKILSEQERAKQRNRQRKPHR